MSEIPNLTQFFGGGPVAPPDGVSTNPTLDFSIPSPHSNPDLHDSAIFTLKSDPTSVFTLPPVGMGHVEVKTPIKSKIDSKSGAGKAKPKSTKTGGEKTKEKVKVVAVDEAWPYIVAAARKLQPGTGPWLVSHPAFDLAKITEVEIELWTDAPKEDAHGMITWEFGYSEIDPKAQSGKGGDSATTTPDAANTQRLPTGGLVGIPTSLSEMAKIVNQNKSFAADQSKAAKP